jgi:hypothetical protein
MKNTKADPRAVPRKGINKAIRTGLMAGRLFVAAKVGIIRLPDNP